MPTEMCGDGIYRFVWLGLRRIRYQLQRRRFDAFVAKLSAAGDHIWSTFLGGAERDDGAANRSGRTKTTSWLSAQRDPLDWVSGGFNTTFTVKRTRSS